MTVDTHRSDAAVKPFGRGAGQWLVTRFSSLLSGPIKLSTMNFVIMSAMERFICIFRMNSGGILV